MESFFRVNRYIDRILILAVIIILSASCIRNKPTFPLELIQIAQLSSPDSNRFDLSGIVIHQDKCFVIADKAWNNYIYEISPDKSSLQKPASWVIDNTISLELPVEIDLEGIDYCKGEFYVVNENGNQVFKIDSVGRSLSVHVNYAEKDIAISDWAKNAGYEGIAVDCDELKLYLAKEREPRIIYKVDLNKGDIEDQFNVNDLEELDYSDIKVENGYLYILERHGNFISKVDLISKKLVARVSYDDVVYSKEGRLYEPAMYGMAEALVLTENEIWIGIDNNGLNASDYGKKQFNIKGNQPSILRFKRPINF